MCPIAFGNHQYGLPRLASRLVGDSLHPPHTCCTSIRPGRPGARQAKCCVVYRYATENNSPWAVVGPHAFDAIRTFAPSVTIANWFTPGSRHAMKTGAPTPVTTGYRHLCRILDKPADKPPIGSALAFAHHRCRLYDLGALGSPAFLDGQCGLSKTFAQRFASQCRSLIRSGNHLPPTIRQKK